MAAVKLGVLGGTFDPVHLAHLVLAERAFEQLGLDRVLWLPAGDPWRKADRVVSPAEHRLAMVRLAIRGNPAFQVCSLELERKGATYSVDTLAALGEEHPNSELVFILGRDALEDLPNWHEPGRLIQLARLAVASRTGEQLAPDGLERLLPGLAARVAWIEMPRLAISGTELRLRAAAGDSLRYLVPEGVEAYIREQGLYRRQ